MSTSKQCNPATRHQTTRCKEWKQISPWQPLFKHPQFIKNHFLFFMYDYYDALCIWFAVMRCVYGPCIAALHVWVALIVPGCVHVCLRFAVGIGSSSVCMFHALILISILVLNCDVLWASLVGLGIIFKVLRIIIINQPPSNHPATVTTTPLTLVSFG